MTKKLKCKYWKLQNLPQRRFIRFKHAKSVFFRHRIAPWQAIKYYAEFADGSICRGSRSYNAFRETFNMYSNVYAVYELPIYCSARFTHFTHSSQYKLRIDKSACVKK